MVSRESSGCYESDLKTEVEDQRQGLLLSFVMATPVVGLVWLTYSLSQSWDLGISSASTLVLWVGAYLAHKLGHKHHHAASWLLVLSLILADGLVVVSDPSSLAIAFGALVIIVANALLGAGRAFVSTTCLWVTVATAWHFGMGSRELHLAAGGSLPFYYLVWAATYVASLPLNGSVASALAGWAQARRALLESRAHRAELYRVVRALEEATYRIERMNNELLVARWQAEDARATKARFVATVSHEIRGPLNLILGFSRLIALFPERYEDPLPVAYHADIDAVYRNSQHLLALVDDILDLSQIEAERLPLVKDFIDLEEDVIKKALRGLRPLAERKGLYVRLQLAGDLPMILADQVRLRQALINLLTNAIRFTERGGITIRSQLRGDSVLVAVQDTGPGIAPDDIPKLFKEFTQLHRSETREWMGSGLGLSISKELIELHRGQIWAESKPGVGTTCYFSLPLPGAAPTVSMAVRTGETRPQAVSPNTCLVVHDDPEMVRLMARYIDGYRVVGVPGQREALALIEELHPRAIITTPAIVGHLENQLAITPYSVPIIGCTMSRAEGRGDLGKVVAYLVKPVAHETLAGVMTRIDQGGETTLLLVDDDPDAGRLLERMLTLLPHPYRILKAYSGRQALDTMKTVIPDIVFMDLIMPELTGEQTIQRMRADDRLRQVPVIIISAKDATEDDIAVGPPISVRGGSPLGVGRCAQCLQALLDAVSPKYLPEAGLS